MFRDKKKTFKLFEKNQSIKTRTFGLKLKFNDNLTLGGGEGYNGCEERRKLHERQRTQGDETRDLKQVTGSIEQIINFSDTIKTIQLFEKNQSIKTRTFGLKLKLNDNLTPKIEESPDRGVRREAGI